MTVPAIAKDEDAEESPASPWPRQPSWRLARRVAIPLRTSLLPASGLGMCRALCCGSRRNKGESRADADGVGVVAGAGWLGDSARNWALNGQIGQSIGRRLRRGGSGFRWQRELTGSPDNLRDIRQLPQLAVKRWRATHRT